MERVRLVDRQQVRGETQLFANRLRFSATGPGRVGGGQQINRLTNFPHHCSFSRPFLGAFTIVTLARR